MNLTNPLNLFICPYCGEEKDRPRANQKTCGRKDCKEEHERKTVREWHREHPKAKLVKNRDTYIINGRRRYSKEREKAELKSQKFACYLDNKRPLPARTLQFFSVEKFVKAANRILANQKER